MDEAAEAVERPRPTGLDAVQTILVVALTAWPSVAGTAIRLPTEGVCQAPCANGATLTGGVDVAVVDAAHAVLAPSVRVRWVERADAVDGWNGLGDFSIHIGATIRLR